MEMNVSLAGRPPYRSSSDRWIFGICGAISQRLSVPTLVVRTLSVILCITILVPILYIFVGFSIPSDALNQDL